MSDKTLLLENTGSLRQITVIYILCDTVCTLFVGSQLSKALTISVEQLRCMLEQVSDRSSH